MFLLSVWLYFIINDKFGELSVLACSGDVDFVCYMGEVFVVQLGIDK